jgi:hypothetical protein
MTVPPRGVTRSAPDATGHRIRHFWQSRQSSLTKASFLGEGAEPTKSTDQLLNAVEHEYDRTH